MPFDDYSDSDESDAEEVATSVLLGLPDGPITSPGDLNKPRISRIGGLPVYTPSHLTAFCDFSNDLDSNLFVVSPPKGVSKWRTKAEDDFVSVSDLFRAYGATCTALVSF